MAFNSNTLTMAEAQLLQQLLTEDLQAGAADFKNEIAIHQSALVALRAHIANMSSPLVLTAGQATIIHAKLDKAPYSVRISPAAASLKNKLRN